MSFQLSYRAAPGNPWFSWQYVRDNSDSILAALREHTWLTARAVVIAALVALPLAVAAYWFRSLAASILALTGVLYTIPSLALFAFFVPITGLSRTTAEIGLIGYTLLILVRNVVTGLEGVPAEVREAARGMGFRPLKQLIVIDFPLALPAIVAGLRIATVTTIGLVTVTALIGQGGLGQLIYDGLIRDFHTTLIVGSVGCVLLAVITDAALVLAQRALTPWSRKRAQL